MPVGDGPRAEVDRRLAVGGEHYQPLPGTQLRHPPLGEQERKRAGEAAGIDDRHNSIVTSQPTLAAVLASGEPERLYSGLSVLVSTGAEGASCAGLATFRALDLILDRDLLRRVQEPEATPSLSWAGRETFATSLTELLATARELGTLKIYACSASVDTMAISRDDVEARLDGVMSTPRFLREAGAAPLIFV